MPIRFHFRLIPFVASLAVAFAGFMLGQWQTRRAVEKEQIALLIEMRSKAPAVAIDAANLARLPADMEYRSVKVKGSFVATWPLYLENRPYQGRAGFYQLMPFKIDGSNQYLLVERGWFPRNVKDRMALPLVPVPGGSILLEGVARHHPGRLLQVGNQPPVRPGALLQNVTAQQVAQEMGVAMLPFVVEQRSDTQDGLIRDWPQASFGSERHRGYAFQWYALAALALLFFVVTGCRRDRSN